MSYVIYRQVFCLTHSQKKTRNHQETAGTEVLKFAVVAAAVTVVVAVAAAVTVVVVAVVAAAATVVVVAE